MTLRRRFAIVSAVVLGLAGTCCGQKAANFRAYKLGDGLPESACISVTVSAQGKVVARHLNLPYVSQLDGYGVEVIPSPEAARSRVYQSPGGQLWAAVAGGLQEYKDGAWVFHPVPALAGYAAHTTLQIIDPVPLCPVRQGLVLILLPDRLLEFSTENAEQTRTRVLRAAADTGLKRFSGMALARDGGLWIAGERGLGRIPGPVRSLRGDADWQEYLLPAQLALGNLRSPREDTAGGVTVVAECTTNQQRALAYFDTQRWTAGPMCNERLRQAWRGADGTFWASTINSLFQWQPGWTDVRETEEFPARQYFDVAVEPGGAFWLATSDGLFRCSPPVWRSPRLAAELRSSVTSLADDEQGRLWFITGGRLYTLDKDRLQDYPLPALAARSPARLFLVRPGFLVLDAEDEENGSHHRLFRFQAATGNFTPLLADDPGRSLKALGPLKNGNLCVLSFGTSEGNLECRLETFDGRRFGLVSDSPPVREIGTNVSAFFMAQNGDLWVGADSGTACYHDRKWQVFASSDKTTPAAAVGFVDTPDGKIWCATSAQIWEFDGHNWLVMRSGFDGVNTLLRGRDGGLWLASNSGVYRFFQGNWIENGPEDGLPSSAVRQICIQNGQLWAGTTRGVSLNDAAADADPPQAFVQQLGSGQNGPAEGSPVTLLFSGQDKWKYTARERLLFSYRLDERDWSVFQEVNRASFSDLAGGRHYFQVRAMDRNWNISKPERLEFLMVVPWYRETRLVLIACLGLGVALFFAGLAFNRHRQLLRSYAQVEQKVAERTHQLELANLELVHSQKMKALGTLAAGIAHDFNNILSIIKGSAQIIEDNVDNADKVRTRTDRIKTVVEQGAGIVRAMLGFSRDSGQDSAGCDLNEVVEDTLKLLGDRFLREVTVRFEPSPSLPEVVISKDLVQQILLNFIFNAAESMSKNREIRVCTAALDRLPQELVLAADSAPGYVSVSVQDFGCGIPPENLVRVFEPFFTTKALSARRGTGLGLSMVYELARKLGAGLAVNSVVEQGSTFTLILPLRPLVADDGKAQPAGEPIPL